MFLPVFGSIMALLSMVGGKSLADDKSMHYVECYRYTDSDRNTVDSNYLTYKNTTIQGTSIRYLYDGQGQYNNALALVTYENGYYRADQFNVYSTYDSLGNDTASRIGYIKYWLVAYSDHFGIEVRSYSDDIYNLKALVTFDFLITGDVADSDSVEVDFSNPTFKNWNYDYETIQAWDYQKLATGYASLGVTVTYVPMSQDEFTNSTIGAYNNGYDNGYSDGLSQGTEDGYNNGYNNGYADGYTQGANQDATATAIFSGIIEIALVPINFFLACLNFEVFGINIGAFVSALLTAAIVVILMRVVLGGNGGGSDGK